MGLGCVYPGGCRTDLDCGAGNHCELDYDAGTGTCLEGPMPCPA
jgi:Cys-rich repeat protein